MFKRLRERIAEEATKFPVGQLSNNSGKLFTEPENKSAAANSTEDLITLSDSSSVVVPHTSSQQFSIGEDEDGSLSEQSTPQRKQNDLSGGQETICNINSSKEHHFGTLSDFGQEYQPSKSLYVPQSDIESEREEPPTLNLDGISKDQLMTAIQTLKAKSYKYKNKYAEVVKNFKELRDEKIKIESTLIENQDKALRRIAELREQCQLEQKAKAHLEANLRLLLEEKDSRISVLETQINLLKEGEKSGSTKALQEDGDIHISELGSSDTKSEDSISSSTSDTSVLQEKVERLQHQHNQDKKTITSQKDQISLLRKQSENLSQELEEKVKRVNDLEDELTKLKSDHESVLKNMQSRLNELEKQQEESIMSMAETKRNMHEELELKEKQLIKAEEEARQFQSLAEHEKDAVAELKKQHEEKVSELQRQLESTEKALEEEKQNLMQELTRGKTAAINLMQQECAKKISSIDEEWKAKWQELQQDKGKNFQSQVEDISKKLNETEEKLKKSGLKVDELSALVGQLEKENASLKNTIAKLESDIAVSHANFEKLKVSYSDYGVLKEKESTYQKMIKQLETVNQDLNSKIKNLENSENELKSGCDSLSQQLNEQHILIDNLKCDKMNLTKEINAFNNVQQELSNTCEGLKNEVQILILKLEEQTMQSDKYALDNNLKLQTICELEEKIKYIQLEEKELSKELCQKKKDIGNLINQNRKLAVSNNALNEEISLLRSSLSNKENDVEYFIKSVAEAKQEINFLNESLLNKQNLLDGLGEKIKDIDHVVIALEEKDACMKSAILKFSKQYDAISAKSDFVFEAVDILIKKYVEACVQNSLKSRCDKGTDCSDVKVDKNDDSSSEVIAIDNSENICINSSEKNSSFDYALVEQFIKVLSENNLTYIMKQNEQESIDVKKLQDALCKLMHENENLREDLFTQRQLLEAQSLEFAKNINQLYKSLSDLQEERNNLSLVLQNFEAHQSSELSSQKSNLCGKTNEKNMEDEDKDKKNQEIKIAEMNSKVVSEIEKLSSQTELVKCELKCLRERFNSAQEAYSEKVKELNAKLLIRTEAMINLKEDLEASFHNADCLKVLLEVLKEQLVEKDELLKKSQMEKKELESKCKVIKEKYYKKECELKELLNSQLNDLKNQTKATIEKLNAEVKTANEVIKEKDSNFNVDVITMKKNYEGEISILRKQLTKIFTDGNLGDIVANVSKFLEETLLCSLTKFDMYQSKLGILNSKVNHIFAKIKEKDSKIAEQCMEIEKLENQIKNGCSLNEKYIAVQNELINITDLLHQANKDLEYEKCERNNCENEIVKWKEKYESEVKKKSDLHRCSELEKEKLQCDLNITLSEFDSLKIKYEQISSSFQKSENDFSELKNKAMELQIKYDSALEKLDRANKIAEDEKLCAEVEKQCTAEWKSKFELIVSHIDKLCSKWDDFMSKCNIQIDEKLMHLGNFEKKFLHFTKAVESQKNANMLLEENLSNLSKELKDLSNVLEREKQKLIVAENSAVEWKAKYENEVSKHNETFQQNEFLKEKLQYEIDKYNKQSSDLFTIQSKLDKSLGDLSVAEDMLKSQKEKFTAAESSVAEWKSKYESTMTELLSDKKYKEQLHLDLEAKNIQISSMVPETDFYDLKRDYEAEIRKNNDLIEKLQEVKTLKAFLMEKEAIIKKSEELKESWEAHHEESLKCMKDKLQNAEKNYKTQMDEMKLKLSQLEKDKSVLENKLQELEIIQNKLKELKNEENEMQSKIQSKDEEIRTLQQKFETLNQEKIEKVLNFQEAMKDKENMVLKLKSNLECLSKEKSEKIEELSKRIKLLEEEREQLMLQAQDRVSTTEAKCREDIKSLQEQNNKLLLENSEIEKLKTKIGLLNNQLDESLIVAESNQAAASQEISSLKEQLAELEEKLTDIQKAKDISEKELSNKLDKLQRENTLLLTNSDHVERLKAEKEELNEKLKRAEQQINEVKQLKAEIDSLKEGNEVLSNELSLLKSVQSERDILQTRIEMIENRDIALKQEIENLRLEKQKHITDISVLKESVNKEIDSLKAENNKLLNRISILEKFESVDPENTALKDYVAVIKGECEATVKAKDAEMEVKLKHLVRDLCAEIDVKNRDYDEIIADLIEKSHGQEEKLQNEHRMEMAALNQALFEKEFALEEMRDYYQEALHEKDEKLKEQETIIKNLSQKTSESFQMAPESSDWDDTWAVPDEVENSSPVHNEKPCDDHLQQIESLQEELSKCNSEIKELKILLRLSPPDSMVNNNNRRDSLQSVPEPTEFEYLKNIIYEYMMGKEPVTLAKVIAAVLRFNDVQTQQVIRREEARHPTK